MKKRIHNVVELRKFRHVDKSLGSKEHRRLNGNLVPILAKEDDGKDG